MIPRLFRSDATQFNSLGLGALSKTVSCQVTESINGEYCLEATVLNDDKHINDVQIGNIIAVKPNTTDGYQAFVIESVTKTIDNLVNIYATHIAQYRAKLIPVSPFVANNLADALVAIKNNSIEANPFTLTTNKSVSSRMAVSVPYSMRELMGGVEGSLIDTYRGEYHFDNYNIELLTRRGADNGIRILYGQNMTDFELAESFSWLDSVTGVLPYWRNEDVVVIGDVQYSSLVDNFKYHKTITLDCGEHFEEQPTKVQLNAYALSWINSKGMPSLTLNVEFNQYGLTSNQINGIRLGDTVNVLNSLYQTSYESRIVSITFDVLAEKYTELQIGSLTANLNDAITSIVDTTSASSSGGGGGTIDVDSAMSSTSENAVMNRVIKSYVDTIAANKVDNVTGKGLSTNDFTNALLTKLNGIATGAEVNVQSNWNETDSTSDAYIQNKPTIPTVNNGTLAINVNGTGVGSFSANQSSDTTANITVPTKTSELTNDSGYITIASVPTKTSELTNDSGFLTEVPHATSSAYGTVKVDMNGDPPAGYIKLTYGNNRGIYAPLLLSTSDTIRSKFLPSATTSTKGAVIVDNAMSDSSTNPVQNSVVKDYIDNLNVGVSDVKVGTTSVVSGGVATIPVANTNDYGAVKVTPQYVVFQTANWVDLTFSDGTARLPMMNKTTDTIVPSLLPSATTSVKGAVIVDNSMSDTSENPVQNKAVKAYIDQVTPAGLITDVQVNGTTVVSNHVASITVPTKVSQLTNDSGYILSTQFITDAEIDAICV